MKLRMILLVCAAVVLSASCVSKTISVPQGPIEFSSVKRIQINQAFPNAEKLQQELVNRGYIWGDDWFGPQEVIKWAVVIGADVDVKTAQSIMAICLTFGADNIGLVIQHEDQGFGDRKRVYIGSLAFDIDKVIEGKELKDLVSAKLAQEQYQNYGQ